MLNKYKRVLGIDFGGSGIKGAPINTKTGEILVGKHRIETPQPATPDSVMKVIKDMANHFEWKGPVGIGFPAVVQNGTAKTAANIDKSWIGLNIEKKISKHLNLPVHAVNDADAAGMAEMKFGAGKGRKGTVLLITIGTGLGTVMFTNGHLVSNLELGHILLNNKDAELFCSDAVRKKQDLSWEDWAKRLNSYLLYLENLLWPELIILGGGVSKKQEKFFDYLNVQAEVLPAQLQNNAGIIGAALYAKANQISDF